jgi:thiol-disulfide isomerase/thioredoxin
MRSAAVAGLMVASSLGASELLAQKKVLIEEFSTTRCGYCPEGHLIMKDLKEKYGDDIIIVGHHAGYHTDQMTIPESRTLAKAMAPGTPSAVFNRQKFPGQQYYAMSRNRWDNAIAQSLEGESTMKVDVSTTWNSQTRTLTIKPNVEVLADVPNQDFLVLNVYVLEDSVMGDGYGYDQTNYNNGTSGHPLQGKGNPIKNYVHRHVLRAMPTGTWGDDSVIPDQVNIGDTFTKQYEYMASSNVDESKLSVVAFVSYNNSADAGFTKITMGATEVPASLTPTSVEEGSMETGSLKVFPNPTSELLRVELPTATNVSSVSIADAQGRTVATFTDAANQGGNLEVSVASLPSGTYTIMIHTDGSVLQEQFVKL